MVNIEDLEKGNVLEITSPWDKVAVVKIRDKLPNRIIIKHLHDTGLRFPSRMIYWRDLEHYDIEVYEDEDSIYN